MQVNSVFIGAGNDADILASRRLESLVKSLPGVYQTHHKILNGRCHGLMVKYDPDTLLESGLHRELVLFDSNRQWNLCDPDQGGCETCPHRNVAH